MVTEHLLADEVVRVAEDYFGPAASRVITRLSLHHLQKDTAALRPTDLNELARWASLAMSIVTEDEKVIAEFMSRIKHLADARV